MIATDGVPSNTALDLIIGLAEAGCTIRLRADFDPTGLAIVEQIRAVAQASTGRRYDVATYAAAAGTVIGTEPLDDATDLAEHLERLRASHHRHGLNIHEEAILHDLLSDLTEDV